MLDFPNSPTTGQIFTGGGGSWKWDGGKWIGVPAGTAGDITGVAAGTGLSGGGASGDVTLSLATPVAIANGGTNATSAAAALTSLGAYPASNPSGYVTGGPYLPIAGGTLTGTLNGTAASFSPASGTVLTLATPNTIACLASFEVNTVKRWTQGVNGAGPWQLTDVTAGAVRLQINNDGSCWNTSGTWSAISDAELKTNIIDYTRGLDAIIQLRPRQFQYTFDADARMQYGLVAQEVEPVMPELVGELEGGIGGERSEPIKTVDPGRAIYALINAVRELAARVETLEAALAAR